MQTAKWAGIALILAGILILLSNYHFIALDWSLLWKFWPVALIIIGLGAIFGKGSSGGLVFILIIFVFFIIGTVYIRNPEPDEEDIKSVTQHFFQENDPSVKRARLILETVGTEVVLEDSTSYLIDAYSSSRGGNYAMERIKRDTLEELRIMRTDKSFSFKEHLIDDLHINLNARLNWVIEAKMDASSADLDLRDFYVDSLSLNMNAASADVYLGSLTEKCRVSLNADASSLDLFIPENTGCEITGEMTLSSRELQGFDNVGEHTFRTPGFDTALQKIWIRIDADVTTFHVRRY